MTTALTKTEWVEEAVDYLILKGIFDDESKPFAIQLAQDLYDAGGADDQCSPEDAIDEELSYWGD